MLKWLCPVLILLGGVSVKAAEAVEVELSVYQQNRTDSTNVLLQRDTVTLIDSLEASGFITGVSMDLMAEEIDSERVTLTVHAHTFATQPGNYARRFVVEYGLPATMNDMVGKDGALYTLRLLPLAPIDVDTSWCGYSHREVEDFHVDPTAHLNIYYVPNTFGDVYWDAVKGMMEEQYETVNRMLRFNMPGKEILYLCPCRIHTVIWDDRFGMMVDPLRGAMFSIFRKDYNSTYPFLVSQSATYRNFGYSPPFLSEGFANYTSPSAYDIQQILKQGTIPPLDTLLDTYTYLQFDPVVADRMGASFVRYLIDRYRIMKFMQLYKLADDLNLRGSIETVYGKSLGELETEWKQYLDTAQTTFAQMSTETALCEAMLNFSQMREYAQAMLDLATNQRDSVEAYGQLTRACFFLGEHYAAIETQEDRVAWDSGDAREWLKLAGYRMICGEYDKAAEDLAQAAAIDSTSSIIRFNLALNRLFVGDTTTAVTMFRKVIDAGREGPELESRVMLGTLLMARKDSVSRREGKEQFQFVAQTLSGKVMEHNASATNLMWRGIAQLELGYPDDARALLETALFLEVRPFYTGMIELWLGKTADVKGNRTEARQHYNAVLAGASALYNQEEAKAYLQTPYRP